MKNILKLHRGVIFLLTVNEFNKVEYMSKLKEKSIETALLACLNVDEISIDQIFINDIEVKTNDILTPDIEDIQEPKVENKSTVYEDLNKLYNFPEAKKSTVKMPVLPFYADLKAFARERYNALKDSTCNALEILQSEIMSQYGYNCTLDGLKNFLAVN